jgi:hypothetical protein
MTAPLLFATARESPMSMQSRTKTRLGAEGLAGYVVGV